ncbi:arsenate-mycothiol transferase ArsC [Methylovirgula sp. 4M-Z18]|uniref:arsenate-mycothiol transferase ArsC n=1 Tax=Methylovirgula sp. 4M-Z18 TaxID=2293567 RepID=UPI001FDF3292|nr:arsenate reductase ArsC [Methylovirgula sp. 4M-Z18]
MDLGRPQAVLFACSHNAVRSPIAEALAKYLFGREIYIASAGVRPGELDGFCIAVMDEMGLDISKHKPHSFEELEDTSFDLIITLSPEAHHKALEMTRTMAVDVVYWPTPDPSAAVGTRDQMLEGYRTLRDTLLKRIKERLGWHAMGSV